MEISEFKIDLVFLMIAIDCIYQIPVAFVSGWFSVLTLAEFVVLGIYLSFMYLRSQNTIEYIQRWSIALNTALYVIVVLATVILIDQCLELRSTYVHELRYYYAAIILCMFIMLGRMLTGCLYYTKWIKTQLTSR